VPRWNADECNVFTIEYSKNRFETRRDASRSLKNNNEGFEYWINLVKFVAIFPDVIPITGSKMNSINWINDFISIENCHRRLFLSCLWPLFPPFTSPLRSNVHYRNYSTILLSPSTIQYQFIIYIMAWKIIDHYRCINENSILQLMAINQLIEGDKSVITIALRSHRELHLTKKTLE
jgi:hypothetical protein